MVTENDTQNKLKEIVNLLPKKNCGKCGYENCPEFAMAVINRTASPFGCRQDSSAGYGISKLLGIAVPEASTTNSGSHAGTKVGAEQGKHHGDKHQGGHGGRGGHGGQPGRPGVQGRSGHSGHHGHN